MALPVLNVVVDFSTGPGFASPMILGTGLLGLNALSPAASVTVDVSDRVDQINTTRGRSLTADQFQTGTLSLRIVDQNGDFNPMNTGGPYYGLLSPMRKVTITATWLGIAYPIFAGYITGYSYVIPNNITESVGHTTITAVDAFQLTNIATVVAVAGTAAGDTTGFRIGKILDAIGWPTSMRHIDAGITTVQADPGTSRAALNALQNLESTELGALYMDASGNFVFKSRTLVQQSAAATPTIFNDNGSAIDYFNAVWRLDDSLIWNSANLTRVGGTMQSTWNTASVALYFLHSFDETGLMNQTDADVLNNARAYVASRCTTSVRCDALILDLHTPNYDAGITAALALDFFSPVTITTAQPGSTSLSKTEQIFAISHAITPQTWQATFTTMEPVIDAFILDSTLSGILDTSVLSY